VRNLFENNYGCHFLEHGMNPSQETHEVFEIIISFNHHYNKTIEKKHTQRHYKSR
jgi:hypothetical protein